MSPEPTLADIEAGVRALQNSPKLQQSLSSLLKAAKGEFDAFMSGLQAWFDRQMDRVTGSYKRWAKRWVIILAIVIVCAGNVDSIAIARSLHASDVVQAIAVQEANDQSFCTTPNDEVQCVAEAANLLESVGIPLGWPAPAQDGVWTWPLKILGLLISVGAAALGAPSGIGSWTRLEHCAIPADHHLRAPNGSPRFGTPSWPQFQPAAGSRSPLVGNLKACEWPRPPKRRIGRKLERTDSASMCFYLIR